MRSSPAKTPARRLRWLAVAGLVAVMPKCLMCLLGYAGLAAALGLAGPELCGAPESSTVSAWMIALTAAGLVLILTGLVAYARYRRSSHAHARGY